MERVGSNEPQIARADPDRPLSLEQRMSLFEPLFRHVRRLALIVTIGVAAFAGQVFAQSTPAPADHPPAAGDDQSAGDSAAVEMMLESRPTLALSGSAEWDDGLRAIMDSFDKIRTEMAKAGLQPGGRPIAVFEEADDHGFRFEAMIPLTAQPPDNLALDQGVHVGKSPAGKTMKFEHRGSYDDIDTTYEAITAYLDEKGLDAQNIFIEEYLNMPKDIDDQDLKVDIYVFLK
jgi:effector-binding domain-containing protein